MNNGLYNRIHDDKQRSFLFDNIKALLIFCVVFAHFLRVSGNFETGSGARLIYIICFTFMMQGFFFISGYFSKDVDRCRAKALETFMLPYFIFMTLTWIERMLLFGSANLHFDRPTHALWFLIVMFVYRFGIKTLSKVPFILPLSAILYLMSGSIGFLGTQFALQRLCSFLVFFMLGYFCQQKHIALIRSVKRPVMLLPLSTLIYLSWKYANQNDYTVGVLLMKNESTDIGLTPIEGVVTRAAMGVAAILWIAILVNLMPDRKLLHRKGIVSEIGANTMTIYLLHIFVRNIMKWVGINDMLPFEDAGMEYCLTILVLSLLCIYLFSRPAVSRAYSYCMHLLYSPFEKTGSLIKQRIQA